MVLVSTAYFVETTTRIGVPAAAAGFITLQADFSPPKD
jgi:hypothetical protein